MKGNLFVIIFELRRTFKKKDIKVLFKEVDYKLFVHFLVIAFFVRALDSVAQLRTYKESKLYLIITGLTLVGLADGGS